MAADFLPDERRVGAEHQGQAGDGAERDEGDGLALRLQHALERPDVIENHAGGGQVGVPQARWAMRVGRHVELAFQRPAGADAEWHPHGVLHFANDFDGVAVGVLDHGVAVGDRDAAHVQLRRIEGQEDRKAVVDPWVCIDDDRLGGGHALG